MLRKVLLQAGAVIKRVIAYSACSQVGYLLMAVGISQYLVALFHLLSHAFFKAVLFIAAGGVLHSKADQQDMRRFEGELHSRNERKPDTPTHLERREVVSSTSAQRSPHVHVLMIGKR